MRVVIDTNIVFSAILNTNSKISKIILQPKSKLNLYSTKQLELELKAHWNKLKKISKYSELELHAVATLITSKIKFIDVELIPGVLYTKAEKLTIDVDIDDTEFVALTEHVRGKLWTGDKELVKGLKRKKWDKLTSTDELYNVLVKRN
ncbi:MAG: putative toxin-antitoxin system toxin component, PIN family [Bacteroidota bacterium]